MWVLVQIKFLPLPDNFLSLVPSIFLRDFHWLQPAFDCNNSPSNGSPSECLACLAAFTWGASKLSNRSSFPCCSVLQPVTCNPIKHSHLEAHLTSIIAHREEWGSFQRNNELPCVLIDNIFNQ